VWWLDDTSGTTLAEQSGLANGTWVNAPELNQRGPSSELKSVRLYFLQSQRGEIPTAGVSALLLGDTFTIEAWVRHTGVNIDGIFSRTAGGAYLRINTRKLELLAAETAVIATSLVDIDTTRWHHVAATKNGANTLLYIDGVSVPFTGTPTTCVDPDTTAHPKHFIGSGTAIDEFYNGGLSSVAIYQSVLSGARIAAHYAAGLLNQFRGPQNYQSGYTTGAHATYATAHATATGFDFNSPVFVGQSYLDSTTYHIYRGVLIFDTSTIPGNAQIVSVHMSTYLAALNVTSNDFDVQIRKLDWSALSPITGSSQQALYDAVLNTSVLDGTLLNTAGKAVSQTYDSVDLDPLWINKGRTTYYCLASSRDISSTPPAAAADEYVNLSGAGPFLLVVEFLTPPGDIPTPSSRGGQ
jgi:hypothetical protein